MTFFSDPVASNGTNGHPHHRNGHHGRAASQPKHPFGKANSQGTMSTRSTMSQGSSQWEEEDRSVGGEVELEPHRSPPDVAGAASSSGRQFNILEMINSEKEFLTTF